MVWEEAPDPSKPPSSLSLSSSPCPSSSSSATSPISNGSSTPTVLLTPTTPSTPPIQMAIRRTLSKVKAVENGDNDYCEDNDGDYPDTGALYFSYNSHLRNNYMNINNNIEIPSSPMSPISSHSSSESSSPQSFNPYILLSTLNSPEVHSDCENDDCTPANSPCDPIPRKKNITFDRKFHNELINNNRKILTCQLEAIESQRLHRNVQCYRNETTYRNNHTFNSNNTLAGDRTSESSLTDNHFSCTKNLFESNDDHIIMNGSDYKNFSNKDLGLMKNVTNEIHKTEETEVLSKMNDNDLTSKNEVSETNSNQNYDRMVDSGIESMIVSSIEDQEEDWMDLKMRSSEEMEDLDVLRRECNNVSPTEYFYVHHQLEEDFQDEICEDISITENRIKTVKIEEEYENVCERSYKEMEDLDVLRRECNNVSPTQYFYLNQQLEEEFKDEICEDISISQNKVRKVIYDAEYENAIESRYFMIKDYNERANLEQLRRECDDISVSDYFYTQESASDCDSEYCDDITFSTDLVQKVQVKDLSKTNYSKKTEFKYISTSADENEESEDQIGKSGIHYNFLKASANQKGLLVPCDLPEGLWESTYYNPLILQEIMNSTHYSSHTVRYDEKRKPTEKYMISNSIDRKTQYNTDMNNLNEIQSKTAATSVITKQLDKVGSGTKHDNIPLIVNKDEESFSDSKDRRAYEALSLTCKGAEGRPQLFAELCSLWPDLIARLAHDIASESPSPTKTPEQPDFSSDDEKPSTILTDNKCCTDEDPCCPLVPRDLNAVPIVFPPSPEKEKGAPNPFCGAPSPRHKPAIDSNSSSVVNSPKRKVDFQNNSSKLTTPKKLRNINACNNAPNNLANTEFNKIIQSSPNKLNLTTNNNNSLISTAKNSLTGNSPRKLKHVSVGEEIVDAFVTSVSSPICGSPRPRTASQTRDNSSGSLEASEGDENIEDHDDDGYEFDEMTYDPSNIIDEDECEVDEVLTIKLGEDGPEVCYQIEEDPDEVEKEVSEEKDNFLDENVSSNRLCMNVVEDEKMERDEKNSVRKKRLLPEIPKNKKSFSTASILAMRSPNLAGEMTEVESGVVTRSNTPENLSILSANNRPILVLKCHSYIRAEDATVSPDSDARAVNHEIDSGHSTQHSPDGYKSMSPLATTANELVSPQSSAGFSSSGATAANGGSVFPQLELLEATHRGLYRFQPRHYDEIEIDIGDPIYVQKEADDLWCEGVNLRTGRQGIFPAAHVTDVDYSEFDPSAARVKKERYLLSYLGSIETLCHKGNQVLCQAVRKIARNEETGAVQPCILEVSDEGIRMLDKSRDLERSGPCRDYFYHLKHVSFCGFHPKDHRYFGFITKHPAIQRFACHVFSSTESTRPVAEAVGRAFQRFYQKYIETAYPIEDIYLE